MEQYNLCGLSSFPGCGLRSIAVRQPPTSGNKGKCTDHKVVFAAALAVGDHSANVAICLERRRATAGEHREECKDEEGAEGRSACDARSAEEVRRGVEGSKSLKQIEKGTTWPKFWSACNKRLKSAAN
jgi:hypothetical protein